MQPSYPHSQDSDTKQNDNLWLFGYASLIWKVDFSYTERANCFIKGFRRVFWQLSPDHRGTPERPGRVCTLVPDKAEESIVHGTVYCLDKSSPQHAEIMEALFFREKAGYSTQYVSAYCSDGSVRKAIVFVGTEDNEHFTGPAPESEIAAHIKECVGPSGPNLEYFVNLLECMRQRGVHDEHLEAIHMAMDTQPEK